MKGNIQKMHAELDDVVQYKLPIGDAMLSLNQYIGKQVSIRFSGTINCIACGRKIKKSFNQGYCFPCMQSLAECDSCIVRPELCHFHQGTCRDAQWALGHCMQPHVVYLANSSGLKVGITRATQVPTRWMDQGATQALPIYEVNSRYASGLVEVAIKKFTADRTDWRKMLKGDAEPLDLKAQAAEVNKILKQPIQDLQEQVKDFACEQISDADVFEIRYPVDRYPEKVTSLNLDKTPEIGGLLQGIKGQYLIFDSGVINIRKYGGYEIEFGL